MIACQGVTCALPMEAVSIMMTQQEDTRMTFIASVMMVSERRSQKTAILSQKLVLILLIALQMHASRAVVRTC
jgi:hypothetical protein